MSDFGISALSILLVEPSPTQSKIITSHLIDQGIEKVDSAHSGQEAIAFIERYPPDLVISAMYLPDMSAVELRATIQDHEDIHFMLVSSETALKALEPVRQAGVIAILPKPFVHQDLARALTTTLDYLNPTELKLSHYDVEELTILLVDDSMMARKHVSRVLRNMGIEHITLAENGLDAIGKLAEASFDLIITDLNMPEMDGQQLVEYVRYDMGDRYIPILMITSQQDDARLHHVQQAGVSAICDKPFEPESVRDILFRVLEEA